MTSIILVENILLPIKLTTSLQRISVALHPDEHLETFLSYSMDLYSLSLFDNSIRKCNKSIFYTAFKYPLQRRGFCAKVQFVIHQGGRVITKVLQSTNQSFFLQSITIMFRMWSPDMNSRLQLSLMVSQMMYKVVQKLLGI